MDPITQGTLGAAVAVASIVRGRRSAELSLKRVALLGALGGMAADLDILIRSSSDPLLNVVFHRHFTHSLAFIPIGGVIVALPFLLSRWHRERWVCTLKATTLGYATHGLLDAFTTYGTQLSLPFSNYRTALSVVSVIDPLFTLPMLAGVIFALRQRHPLWCWLGLLWGTVVLSFGAVQQQRASAAQREVAAARGHSIERSALLPTFANNITWRSLYESDGQVHVDAISVPWLTGRCVTTGSQVDVVPPETAVGPAGQRALRLLRWFSDGWVARSGEHGEVLGDLRYSFDPAGTPPIWGVRLLDDDGEAIARSKVHQVEAKAVDWVNASSSRRVSWTDFAALFVPGPDADCQP